MPEKRIKSAEDLSQAFGVSRETLERLITYEALLQRWQKTINLVAPATLTDAWHRHFAQLSANRGANSRICKVARRYR